ncbi:uncharacterized protein A1O9_02162 [Exophiala aquamarina CBS 119918]|uniref:Zn(2)-C6 fungal-type domain-containing protein n=1 Tax=Exophiala aquamarina CBS 119918 TaxID=1182545 RepID=A0A072PL39_9EURO|nr:uncharacterized protein A1O9_02162 [Exophiala aquamarina CBS 119918]KEF60601.1 hypothetical protein A1O9_02162 [Exophiala aquamarina CBS 119918]
MASSDLIHGKTRKARSKGVVKAAKTTADSSAEQKPLLVKSKLPKNPSRRSHTKSRRGCFTCKTRKIKCDEGTPSCSHCVYRGSACIYPRTTEIGAGAGAIREPTIPGRIFVPFQPKVGVIPASPSEKLVFTAQEMRFFHYFLTSMKHPLPIGNRAVWVHEIPQIAHEYPFLLHAILSLGASEMERTNQPMPLQYDVLKHQGRAISGLNKALDDSKAWNTYGHPDAVLATCYALIYQSSRIVDGMKDFQVLVQGCALITDKIQQSRLKTVLNVDPDWPSHKIHAGMQHIQASLQAHHMALVKSGLETLREIQASKGLTDEHLFWKACYVTLDQFCSSPVEGYSFSIMRYSMWYHLAGGMLKALRGPDNGTVLVLIASFMSNMILLKVLIPFQIWPDAHDRLPMCTLRRMVHCIEVIDEHIGESDGRYVAWAKQVVRLLSEVVPEIQHDELSPKLRSSKIAILRDLQTSAHMFLGDVLRLGSEVTAWFEEFVSDMIMCWASPRRLKPTTEAVGHIMSSTSSVQPLVTSTATRSTPMRASPSYPSPLEMDKLTPSNITQSAQGQDETYLDRSLLDVSATKSDSFAFRIFSQLDRGWQEGHSTLDDPDEGMNDSNNDEMFEFFHV